MGVPTHVPAIGKSLSFPCCIYSSSIIFANPKSEIFILPSLLNKYLQL